MIRGSNQFEESYRVAGEYADKACRKLDGLPDSVYRGQSLLDLATYIIRRQH